MSERKELFKRLDYCPQGGPIDVCPPFIDVSGIKRKVLDVPYASQSPSQRLDIYLPDEGDGPFPAFIFIHGGAFHGGDKRDAQVGVIFNALLRGFAVVSVEQRLSDEAKFPAGLFDFKSAIRFLRANAADYKLDPERFISGGTSAGAYFAVMAAATQGNPAFEDFSAGCAGVSSAVKGVISWFGLFDLGDMDPEKHGVDPVYAENGMDMVDNFFGAPKGDVPGLAYFANPVNFITPEMPPILIMHGTADRLVPMSQPQNLYGAIAAVCGPERATLRIYEGYPHGDIRYNDYLDMYIDFARGCFGE